MSPQAPATLAGLHDVVAPPPVSWAPQTVGWVVLAAILVVLAAGLGWRVRKRAKANRYRKVALAEIDRIAGAPGDDPTAALGRVNEVLKRVALTAWPRAEVASLTGPRWLEFLDNTGGGREFREGPGVALAHRVYAPGSAADAGEGREAFLDVVRRWIRHHRVAEATRDGRSPAERGPANGVAA